MEWTRDAFVALPKVCAKSSAKSAVWSPDFRLGKSFTAETVFLEKSYQISECLLVLELFVRSVGQHYHRKIISTSNSLRQGVQNLLL